MNKKIESEKLDTLITRRNLIKLGTVAGVASLAPVSGDSRPANKVDFRELLNAEKLAIFTVPMNGGLDLSSALQISHAGNGLTAFGFNDLKMRTDLGLGSQSLVGPQFRSTLLGYLDQQLEKSKAFDRAVYLFQQPRLPLALDAILEKLQESEFHSVLLHAPDFHASIRNFTLLAPRNKENVKPSSTPYSSRLHPTFVSKNVDSSWESAHLARYRTVYRKLSFHSKIDIKRQGVESFFKNQPLAVQEKCWVDVKIS